MRRPSAESSAKYGGYCYQIAFRILALREDAEECVGDTWLRAWEAMPPSRPGRLDTFLGKITRNLSLDRWRAQRAQKRWQGQAEAGPGRSWETACSAPGGVEQEAEAAALAESLDRFLAALPQEKRVLFVRRYWYLCSIEELAAWSGKRRGTVSAALFRLRQDLREHLERGGIHRMTREQLLRCCGRYPGHLHPGGRAAARLVPEAAGVPLGRRRGGLPGAGDRGLHIFPVPAGDGERRYQCEVTPPLPARRMRRRTRRLASPAERDGRSPRTGPMKLRRRQRRSHGHGGRHSVCAGRQRAAAMAGDLPGGAGPGRRGGAAGHRRALSLLCPARSDTGEIWVYQTCRDPETGTAYKGYVRYVAETPD